MLHEAMSGRLLEAFHAPHNQFTPTKPVTEASMAMIARRRDHVLETSNRRTVTKANPDGTTSDFRVTVPSEFGHYDNLIFDWDTRFAVSMLARDGKPQAAAEELQFVMSFVDPDTGFLSNKIFIDKKRKRISPSSRIESFFANDKKFGNSYTQPPIHAWAAMEVYESYARIGQEENGLEFLKQIYGTPGDDGSEYTGLQGAYAFFAKQRLNNQEQPLVGSIDPRETGRDTDHACDMDGKKIGILSTLIFMGKASKRGKDPEGKRKDWLPEKMREKYWLNDVMVNALYVSNLRYLSDISTLLGKDKESKHYEGLAAEIETTMLSTMWRKDPDKVDPEGFFYNLNKDGDIIDVPSVTGLFPLLLKNIPVKQLNPLLDKLNDPTWFGTNYPVPSHPVASKYYRADNKHRIAPPWDGPVWINLNHLLVEEGLVQQEKRFYNVGNAEQGDRCRNAAKRIVDQTTKLQVMNSKTMEAYDEDGQGIRVRGFMWSNLRFEKFDALERERALASAEIS